MNSKWISVEKEPEINQWIFIYVGAKNPVMGCYKGGGKILDSSLNEIWNFTEDEIKFWQPLPLPPTEEPNTISNESIGKDEAIKQAAYENCKLHYIMAFSDELLIESTIDFEAGVEWQKNRSVTPNVMVGEDELVEKFIPLVDFDKDGLVDTNANKCAEVALQYHQSKLGEL